MKEPALLVFILNLRFPETNGGMAAALQIASLAGDPSLRSGSTEKLSVVLQLEKNLVDGVGGLLERQDARAGALMASAAEA